jgi:hypothetical protein
MPDESETEQNWEVRKVETISFEGAISARSLPFSPFSPHVSDKRRGKEVTGSTLRPLSRPLLAVCRK